MINLKRKTRKTLCHICRAKPAEIVYNGKCEDCWVDAGVGRNTSKPYNFSAEEGDVLSQPVSELDLPIQAINLLEENKISRIRDLVLKTEQDLLKIRRIGPGMVGKIRKALRDFQS